MRASFDALPKLSGVLEQLNDGDGTLSLMRIVSSMELRVFEWSDGLRHFGDGTYCTVEIYPSDFTSMKSDNVTKLIVRLRLPEPFAGAMAHTEHVFKSNDDDYRVTYSSTFVSSRYQFPLIGYPHPIALPHNEKDKSLWNLRGASAVRSWLELKEHSGVRLALMTLMYASRNTKSPATVHLPTKWELAQHIDRLIDNLADLD